ncbi:MAG: DUF1122 family protein [Nitrospinota bacterium]
MNQRTHTIPQPLEALDDRSVGPYTLHLARCEPLARRSGWRRIALSLTDGSGQPADGPVVEGFYSVAGLRIGSWLDCDVYPVQAFDGREADLAAEGVTLELFRLVGEAITSHCMVAYEVWERTAPLHAVTEQSYQLGIPPAATPVGELLVAAGCVAGFKDWYIAEGGTEGPRKLQAEKPPTGAAREAALTTLAHSLTTYLARRPGAGGEAVERDCRSRAVRLLEGLQWPEVVGPVSTAVAAAAAGADDLLRDGPERVREALASRRPPWSLEDEP